MKLFLDGNRLEIKEGLFAHQTYLLDSLRIVTLSIPKEYITFAIVSIEQTSFLQLDLIDNNICKTIIQLLIKYSQENTSWEKIDGDLYLIDYENNSLGIPIDLIVKKYPNLLQAILDYREERRPKLFEWLRTNPVVYLTHNIYLGKDGFKKGETLIPWSNIEEIWSSQVNFNHDIRVKYKRDGGVQFIRFLGDLISSLAFFENYFGFDFFVLPSLSEKEIKLWRADINFWQQIYKQNQPMLANYKPEVISSVTKPVGFAEALFWFWTLFLIPIGFMRWGQGRKGWMWLGIVFASAGIGFLPCLVDYWMSFSAQRSRNLEPWEFFPRTLDPRNP